MADFKLEVGIQNFLELLKHSGHVRVVFSQSVPDKMIFVPHYIADEINR